MGVKINAVGLRSSAASLSQRLFISFPLVLLLLPPELNPLLMASVRCHGNRQGWSGASLPPGAREPGWGCGGLGRWWAPPRLEADVSCGGRAWDVAWSPRAAHYSSVLDLLPHALGLSVVRNVGLCCTWERG